jgi:hypothetical protein
MLLIQVLKERLAMFKAILSLVGVAFLTLLLVIVAYVAWGLYAQWDLERWDARVDALCAADGGKAVATRIYETVAAPDDEWYFAETKPMRAFKIPERSQGQTLGPQYPYVMETRVTEVIREKNPSVIKYTERIVRVSDDSVIAERFAYQRSGGGIPGFDPGVIRNCPVIHTEDRLDVLVFTNHPRHIGGSSK